MKQKIIFFITLLILVNLKAFSLENVNIVFKIDEEIITNIDVKKEAKFLVALNTNLETLNEKKLTD
ncbi:MAG: peptidylprolyl isomerase, partial [Candidatus Pelagibacter sp.]|nr:peptidylprolyl isomerase [Candidatus Pelagibacter sp.]